MLERCGGVDKGHVRRQRALTTQQTRVLRSTKWPHTSPSPKPSNGEGRSNASCILHLRTSKQHHDARVSPNYALVAPGPPAPMEYLSYPSVFCLLFAGRTVPPEELARPAATGPQTRSFTTAAASTQPTLPTPGPTSPAAAVAQPWRAPTAPIQPPKAARSLRRAQHSSMRARRPPEALSRSRRQQQHLQRTA